MALRHLYLVRHGQRETGLSPDDLGPGLTVLGWKQAHQAARRLSALKMDVIHTSSLRRTMETAQILAVEQTDVPIRPSRLLWECIPALPEAVFAWFKAHPETDPERLPRAVQPWRGMLSEFESPERLEADFEQARQAWEKYFIPAKGKDRHEVLVGHGNLIRYFVLRALQAPPEGWLNMDIYNCSICEIVVEGDGRARLVSHNDSGHLHADQLTFF
jgi:serine/threonine-protein phosphatase PGAM5